jgi:DNA (cytosine-5)-methyltransferase 1
VKALSLYTGAGGLDIGLERSGFEIAGTVEIDPDSCKTLKANRPRWRPLTPGDIHSHRPSAILSAFGLSVREETLLIGGPPCQPFSKSGQWRNGRPPRMTDARARTLRAYLALLDALQPQLMLLENVQGMLTARRRQNQHYEGLDVLNAELGRINRRRGTRYQAVPLLLDAADYGVPQHRRRLFVFAARDGAVLDPPPATHGPNAPSANGHGAQRLANTWDALHDLDDLEPDPALLPSGKWADLLPSIPEGHNYLHHTSRGEGEPIFGWRRRYWSFLLKLAKARPSWTIQAQAGSATGPFHWRSRRLSPAELARLQCFPDDWEIAGAATSARRQLGNAVPPPLAEELGLQIRRQVLSERPRRKPSLTPPLRDDLPDPEALEPVPPRYLDLEEETDEHPGSGRGPGAIARRRARS